MSGRTCQFCGKALSRFSVGSDGDFCSREHRNQFRLRSGMDRLMEANKVTSLMRRRENAKTIPTSQMARDYKVQPRVAPVLHIPVRPPDVQVLHPPTASFETPRMVSRSRDLFLACPSAAAIRGEVRPIETGGFSPQRTQLSLPKRSPRFPVEIKQAGAVLPRLNGARLAELRRQVMELRLNLQRDYFGGDGIQVRPLKAAARTCQEAQPARRLNGSADRGCELRVSGGIGFRVSRPRVRAVEFAQPQTSTPLRSGEPRELRADARSQQSESKVAGQVRFIVRMPSAPSMPKQHNGPEFRWPNACPDGNEQPRETAVVNRSCQVRWVAPGAQLPRFRYRNGVAHLRVEPAIVSLEAPQPRGLGASRRLTLVQFQTREVTFECPSALHGTLLGGGAHLGAAAVRKMEAPPAALEEHFDGGLQNWMGGVANWKVDVAGVRPGSLALYSPSLEIPHYTLEFLTRIESRSVTWVFRAANLNDYYEATLAVLPAGGYEFRRCAVIGGEAEAPTVRHVQALAVGGKTAVTIRTRVVGNEFTVSLDGQPVETWTDARLTAGGIGFIGAPEERTRLYWVKVTPTGHVSKEYLKR